MKKIDVKLIIIAFLLSTIAFLIFRGPTIKEVEKIVEVGVEVPVEVHDTIPYEVEVPYLVEVPVEVPKEVEKIVVVHDTIKTEKIVKVPVEVIKEVDKIVEVQVPNPKQGAWFLGFGYQYDYVNYFSGTDVKIVHKFKNDKMFSLDVGLRNNLLDKETNVGKLSPYIGTTLYFRLDK